MIVTIDIANVPPELVAEYRAISTETGGRLSLDNQTDVYRNLVRKRKDIPETTSLPLPQNKLSARVESVRRHRGAEIWVDIHAKLDPNPKWFNDEILTRVAGLGGCGCRKKFETIRQRLPEDYSSPDAFFVRSVEQHNAVNDELGKPQMSLSDARIKYKR